MIASEIMLPPHAPEIYLDRATLWNAVENCEKHPKAQLAYSFDIAMQNELTLEENMELARKFVQEQFVTKGMIADLAFHSPEKEDGGIPNPHFHVMTTMRPLNPDGTWGQKQRREYLLDEDGNRIRDKNGDYLLWYICNWFALSTNNCIDVFQEWFNELFQSEYVGYRFISGEIVPITDEIEVKEIEQACCTPFDGARKHLKKALNFLSDREHPDYKNCVKESISAVEATCRIIAEKDSATLGEALKLLAKHGLKLHPCLNSGIDKLYSYACDQGGVRHAEHEAESIVTFEEAKFMMVTCSAIVNYLVAEYGKHGTENA